jgi:hypothetical protein
LVERLRSLLPVSPLAAGAALLGAICFVLAFALGRATGSEERAAPPSLAPVRVAAMGPALPQLSEAAPLPALAPPVRRTRPVRQVVRPRPVARPRPAPRPSRTVRRQKPATPKTPVVIVGSG